MQADDISPAEGQRLFAALQRAQPGGYALWVDMGREQVLSVSPELFFDWHQPAQGSGHILTRPMKGTAPRGATPEQDARQAEHLRTAPKERAENVMIVDLLRNDLGRLAETGSVHVERLFDVQALPSVWQMTSDVRARLPQGTTLRALLGALFPCGSVTGAPKQAAMQAIAALESGPRGWYCGALGVVRPDGAGGLRATFNVPIRTLVLTDDGQLACGIGSGITADARADGEWREWGAKRAFIERVSEPFELLETLALEDGAARHADLHLARLAQAAAHFGHPWSPDAAQQALHALARQHPSGLWRVRLLLHAGGRIEAQAFACPPSPARVQLQWATAPLAQAHGEFVRFKTTRRAHYDAWTPQDAQVFDTLLWNEDREITECTRGNIAALLDGRWLTPPLHCGLLPGVGRAVALAQGRVREGVIRLEDAPRVQAWAFVNSLRGWIPAEMTGPAPI
jgi:para-aminobenzoate synthetase/4-amino-4-deoxychorismate lyase